MAGIMDAIRGFAVGTGAAGRDQQQIQWENRTLELIKNGMYSDQARAQASQETGYAPQPVQPAPAQPAPQLRAAPVQAPAPQLAPAITPQMGTGMRVQQGLQNQNEMRDALRGAMPLTGRPRTVGGANPANDQVLEEAGMLRR